MNALIATEDERYHEHSGIDFPALGRVAIKTVLLGQRSSGGASTITQQLAKLLFTGQAASNMTERIIQKLKEWIIAVRQLPLGINFTRQTHVDGIATFFWAAFIPIGDMAPVELSGGIAWFWWAIGGIMILGAGLWPWRSGNA